MLYIRNKKEPFLIDSQSSVIIWYDPCILKGLVSVSHVDTLPLQIEHQAASTPRSWCIYDRDPLLQHLQSLWMSYQFNFSEQMRGGVVVLV